MREGLVTSSSSSSQNGDEKDTSSCYYYPHHHHHHRHHHHHHHHHTSYHRHRHHHQHEHQHHHQQMLQHRQPNDHHHLHHLHQHHHHQQQQQHQEQQQQQLHRVQIHEQSGQNHFHAKAHLRYFAGCEGNSSPDSPLQQNVEVEVFPASITLDDPNWKFFDDDEVIDDRPVPTVDVPIPHVASLARVRRSQISSISTTTTTLSPLSLSPPYSATVTGAAAPLHKRFPMTGQKTDSLSDELIPPTPPPRRFSNRLLEMCSYRRPSGDDCAFGPPSDDVIIPFVGRNSSVEDSDGAGSIITTMTQSTTLDNQSGSLGQCTTPLKYQPQSTPEHVTFTRAVVHQSPFDYGTSSPLNRSPHLMAPNPVMGKSNCGRMRRIASGLRLAQSQAMAVAGFLPESMDTQNGADAMDDLDTMDSYGEKVDVGDRDCGEILDISSSCSLQIAQLDDIICIYDSGDDDEDEDVDEDEDDNDDNNIGRLVGISVAIDDNDYRGAGGGGDDDDDDDDGGSGGNISSSKRKPTIACYSDTNLAPTPLTFMDNIQFRPHTAAISSSCQAKVRHRSSYHGEGVPSGNEQNGGIGQERMVQSTPGSPFDQRRPTSFEVIGSAESLVGRVLVAEGLGKYCDPDFVAYTSREMQEALDMTREEMDMAAHQILLHERSGSIHSGNGLKSSSNDNSSRVLSNFTSPSMQYSPVNAVNRRQSQLLSPMSSPASNHQQQQHQQQQQHHQQQHHHQQQQQQQQHSPHNLSATSTGSIGNRSTGSTRGPTAPDGAISTISSPRRFSTNNNNNNNNTNRGRNS